MNVDLVGGVERVGERIVVELAGMGFFEAVAPDGVAGEAEAFGAVGDEVEGGVGSGGAAIGEVDGNVVGFADGVDGVVSCQIYCHGARLRVALRVEDTDIADVVHDVGEPVVMAVTSEDANELAGGGVGGRAEKRRFEEAFGDTGLDVIGNDEQVLRLIAIVSAPLDKEIGGGSEDLDGAGIGANLGFEIHQALRREGDQLDEVGVAILEGAEVEIAKAHDLVSRGAGDTGGGTEGNDAINDLARGGIAVEGDLGAGDMKAGRNWRLSVEVSGRH